MSAVPPAVAWLERSYDEPGALQRRSTPWIPRGFFQIKPDHGCPCGNPRYASLWTHLDAAAKWKAGGES